MNASSGWLAIGAIMGGIAVSAGALGAHGLDHYFVVKYADQTRELTGETVSAAQKALADFKTGAEYQMYHALALLTVGLLSLRQKSRGLQIAGWAFTIGILLFSGSLYTITLTDLNWWKTAFPLGRVLLIISTPLGGVLLIVGWLALAISTCCCRKETAKAGDGAQTA